MRISSLGAYIWATPHWEKNFCGIASKASMWYGWEGPPIEHRKRTLSRAFAGMRELDRQKVLHSLSRIIRKSAGQIATLSLVPVTARLRWVHFVV